MSDPLDACRGEVERFLLDETGELTLLVDLEGQGTMVAVRGPSQQILGLDAAACAGLSVSRLRPDTGTRRLMAFGPALLAEPGFFGEVGLRHDSGVTRIVSVRVHPFATAEGARRALVRVVDVSEQVNLTHELRSAHVSLQQAFRALSEQERSLAEARRSTALSLFAAALSHELNNPLASMTSCLYTLREDLEALSTGWPAQVPRPEELPEMSEISAELGCSLQRIALVAKRLSELEIPLRKTRYQLVEALRGAAAEFQAVLEPSEAVQMNSDPAALGRMLIEHTRAG